MAPSSLTLVGGLLLGLASSLHCAMMCGGIATSLMFAFDRRGTAARAQALIGAQLGRIGVYVASGSFLGFAGASFYGAFDHATAYLVLRWAAAVALGWIGLSVAGLAPTFVGLSRLVEPLTQLRLRFADAGGAVGPVLSGFAWGCMPCGMVYGALFYAMLTGSALGGASVMLGFGLGTLPAVTAVALGMSSFRNLARNPKVRTAVGLGITAVAAASVDVPALVSNILCLH